MSKHNDELSDANSKFVCVLCFCNLHRRHSLFWTHVPVHDLHACLTWEFMLVVLGRWQTSSVDFVNWPPPNAHRTDNERRQENFDLFLAFTHNVCFISRTNVPQSRTTYLIWCVICALQRSHSLHQSGTFLASQVGSGIGRRQRVAPNGI